MLCHMNPRLSKTRQLVAEKKEVFVVGYGDSITEVGVQKGWYGGCSSPGHNWLAVLCSQLSARHGVAFLPKHFAVAGHNTYEALGRTEFLTLLKPDLVVIQLGTNDVGVGWHELSPQQTRTAMSRLIDEIGWKTNADIVLVSTSGNSPLGTNCGYDDVTVEVCKEVAMRKNVPFGDFRRAALAATDHGKDWPRLFKAQDDCHPNDAGHALLAKVAFDAIHESNA
jgi:lysophospholipase L1-like esterase